METSSQRGSSLNCPVAVESYFVVVGKERRMGFMVNGGSRNVFFSQGSNQEFVLVENQGKFFCVSETHSGKIYL